MDGEANNKISKVWKQISFIAGHVLQAFKFTPNLEIHGTRIGNWWQSCNTCFK